MKKLEKEKTKQEKLEKQDILDNEYNLVCLNRQIETYKGDDLNRYFRKFCK
ncbi:hypothetical protein K0040_18380 [Terrisporobacter petrolearius]|uniref:hypothetical protein n=1 Tax=Terrisporobacter petrolearius TaxID=1460447 RepID=UPI001D16687F|nr:hypothetical protein [Terrisporobacter petrolearius]MCC3866219.1 hypothetical protein [Terrisporobacter petrolearius]